MKTSIRILALVLMAATATAGCTKGGTARQTTEERTPATEGSAPATEEVQEDNLESALRSANAQLPSRMGIGLVMTAIHIEGDYVFYEYEVDEELTTFGDIKESVESEKGRETIALLAVSMQGGERQFLTKIVEAGKGLGYRYRSRQSGETAVASLTNAELKSLF
ncbi:MAG: hypothetical protein IJV08_01955 [Bacteroidaceae bacterium]|nr:hypothetical protein [Bacteroidaceae bacterium]